MLPSQTIDRAASKTRFDEWPHYKSPDWWSADFYRPDRADTMMKEMADQGGGERAEAKLSRRARKRGAHFTPRHLATIAGLEPVQFEAREPHPLQPRHLVTNGVEDAAHLPVLSFVQLDDQMRLARRALPQHRMRDRQLRDGRGRERPRTVTA